MGRAKISTTVYFERDQYDALKKLSERTRVPFAIYVRDGLDYVLRREGAIPKRRAPATIPAEGTDE
jgi:hypothetical protein